MSTSVSAAEVVTLGEQVAVLRAELEQLEESLERALSVAVGAWSKVEPVPCGHTGGWSFEAVCGSDVRLIHECFYAHQYDREVSYSTTVSLDGLLAAAP